MYTFNRICLCRNFKKIQKLNTLRKMSTDLPKMQNEQKILQPFMHIYRSTSKHYMAMFKAVNYWLEVPEEKLNSIEELLRMIHTTSLMIDDIQDDSTFRYGVPAAHCIYSKALINNGIRYAFASILKKVLPLGPQAVEIYIQGIIDGFEAQGIEIYRRDNMECPSEEEYLNVIKKKTSFIFVMANRLMQLFSENNTDYSKIMNQFGTYLQIRDDYVNLLDQKHEDNKSYCTDITEGKFSFPLIHAYQHSDSSDQIRNILKLRTRDLDLKKYCVSILEKADSFNYTKEKLRDLETQIYDEMAIVGVNPQFSFIMDQLGDWKDDSAKYNGYAKHF